MALFLLDEMYSQITAEIARRGSADIVSIHESRHEGAQDEHVLMMGARSGRIVITENHRHFVPLTREFAARGLPHAGVLLVPGNVPHEAFAQIANAIIRFARESPEGLQPYEIRWLHVDLG